MVDPKQLSVDVNNLVKLSCKCGSEHFIDVIHVRFAPALLSPKGVPTFVRVPKGFLCGQCGEINSFEQKLPISPGQPLSQMEGEEKVIVEGDDNGD